MEFGLGQKLEEVRSHGEFFAQSNIFPDGQSIVAEDSSVHFIDERVCLIGGTLLRMGTETVICENDTREEVFTLAEKLGWPVTKEWKSYSDVPGYSYSVVRFQVSADAYLLVCFFYGPDLEKVSEIYLRSHSVIGPYGDR